MPGGVGKIVGAVIGAYILGVGIDWQQGIKGLVRRAAVIFDAYNKNKGKS